MNELTRLAVDAAKDSEDHIAQSVARNVLGADELERLAVAMLKVVAPTVRAHTLRAFGDRLDGTAAGLRIANDDLLREAITDHSRGVLRAAAADARTLADLHQPTT